MSTNKIEIIKIGDTFLEFEHIHTSICLICNSEHICEKGDTETRCDDCKKQNLCIHKIQKQNCDKCQYTRQCWHNRQKHLCVSCKGCSICEHKKRKDRCRICKGVGICEHNKLKVDCKECKGSNFCEHGIRKNTCIPCEGSQRCEHGKFKRICKLCGGKNICEHNLQRSECRKCKGSAFCEHDGKRKVNCNICSPHLMCQHCKYNIPSKFKPYCALCYWHLHPELQKPRANTKELLWRKSILNFFEEHKLQADIIFDKKIQGGCSKRRPDGLIERFTHCLVLECDEFGHSNYNEICENKRLMEIFEDLGRRPIVFLRFNPDKKNYEDRLIKYLSRCKELLSETINKEISIEYF